MKLRKAKIADAPQIHKLIRYYADKKLMLPRAISEIYEHLQEFFVIEHNSNIIGCCSLHITWEDLAEIKSLAVAGKYRKHGLGLKLMVKCEESAKTLGVKKIFALSFIPKFFEKFGYKKIAKSKLPQKIWIECIRCPMFPDCKEIPLLKQI